MNLVQVLAQLGGSCSLKQFQSIKQMAEANRLSEEFIMACSMQSKELICLVEPEDED